jgi:hypothetical protein
MIGLTVLLIVAIHAISDDTFDFKEEEEFIIPCNYTKINKSWSRWSRWCSECNEEVVALRYCNHWGHTNCKPVREECITKRPARGCGYYSPSGPHCRVSRLKKAINGGRGFIYPGFSKGVSPELVSFSSKTHPVDSFPRLFQMFQFVRWNKACL